MSLHDIFQQYHDSVEFLMIYIREAHPVDGWWFGGGVMGFLLKAGQFNAATDVYDPTTIEKRREVAGNCQESLKYGIRTYVDEMNDAVSTAYAAMPTRLYLVGLDGRVEYAGGLGPAGFKPVKFRNAIRRYLAQMDAVQSTTELSTSNHMNR